jgi:hypothetical protein
MANMDAFSAQIVELVRRMPDEAILALVKNQLGAVASIAPSFRAAAPGRRAAAGAPNRAKRGPGRPAKGTRRGAGRRGPAAAAKRAGAPRRAGGAKRARPAGSASAERQEALGAVEKIVKSSSGLSASEVAKQAGVPQPRAAAALKELKLAKRIFQGGDRRFARYAGDARSAEQASMNARKTASGPLVAPPKKAGKKGSKKSK